MKNIWIVLLVLFFSSCKGKTSQMVSIFSSEKDTVMKKLHALPDTALTRIQIDPYIFMFDTVKRGSIVTGKFKITNMGHKPFEVAQIITFCDCTTIQNKDKFIQPGDSSSLDFILNTDSFQKGYNERALTILGNFKPYFRTLKIEGYIVK